MALTFPATLPANGDLEDATPLSINLQAIQQKFGNIVDDDIATGAGISGAKLAAGSLPGDRIAPKTVSQTQQGLLSVGTPELIDLGVTKAKVATAVGSQMTQAQVAIFTQTLPIGGLLSPTNTVVLVPGSAIPTATYTIIGCYLYNIIAQVNGTPQAALVANVEVLGANYVGRVTNASLAGGTPGAGNLVIVYMTKS
jgi:hypothetical protein